MLGGVESQPLVVAWSVPAELLVPEVSSFLGAEDVVEQQQRVLVPVPVLEESQ